MKDTCDSYVLDIRNKTSGDSASLTAPFLHGIRGVIETNFLESCCCLIDDSSKLITDIRNFKEKYSKLRMIGCFIRHYINRALGKLNLME